MCKGTHSFAVTCNEGALWVRTDLRLACVCKFQRVPRRTVQSAMPHGPPLADSMAGISAMI